MWRFKDAESLQHLYSACSKNESAQQEQHLPTHYIAPHIMKKSTVVNNIYRIHQMVLHIMYILA